MSGGKTGSLLYSYKTETEENGTSSGQVAGNEKNVMNTSFTLSMADRTLSVVFEAFLDFIMPIMDGEEAF